MTQLKTATLLQDLPVAGEYSVRLLASKLEHLSDSETSEDAAKAGPEAWLRRLGNAKKQPWISATHQFGYIAPPSSGSVGSLDIQYPGAIAADTSLKNQQINIRLDRLRVHKYPGGGTHNVMITFAARNQVAHTQECVGFSQTYRIPEGQSAGLTGYPIFIGLTAGSQGIAFECSTINVNNEADQSVLEALESSPFQSGLKLLTTAQPAIAPFTEITLGVVKALAQRNENIAVQKFYLGLDFENAAMGVRLVEGNYIAAQVPSATAIEWHKWIYRTDIGAIVHRADRSELLPYNYLVFRISRYVD